MSSEIAYEEFKFECHHIRPLNENDRSEIAYEEFKFDILAK